MYSEIAAVVPAPIHAAIAILCLLVIPAIGVFHAVKAVRNRKRRKALERRIAAASIVSGWNNWVICQPSRTGTQRPGPDDSDEEFREKLHNYRVAYGRIAGGTGNRAVS
jgi:hypothetical protein